MQGRPLRGASLLWHARDERALVPEGLNESADVLDARARRAIPSVPWVVRMQPGQRVANLRRLLGLHLEALLQRLGGSHERAHHATGPVLG